MSWTLHTIDRFAGLAQDWDLLQQRCGNTAFLESAFLLPLLKEFGDGTEMLALQRRQDRLVAAAIVHRVSRGRWQIFQPSQLPLGALLCPAEVDLEALLPGLLSALPGLAMTLGAPQLDSLLNPRPAGGARLRTQDYIDTAWLEIDGDFDSYWEARGKNLRQNTKKQRNKLVAEGVSATLECVSDAAQIEAAMRDYGALESAGWKAADGTAIHPDNAQGRFYRQMLENFCRQGRGRIYRYRFDDKVVSMDLCIVSGPVIVILKTAYDESYKALSPSTLMRQQQFQQFFEDGGYRRIEFYGKVMEWHTRWTDKARPIYHATCYRWPLLKRLHAALRPAPAAAPAAEGAPA